MSAARAAWWTLGAVSALLLLPAPNAGADTSGIGGPPPPNQPVQLPSVPGSGRDNSGLPGNGYQSPFGPGSIGVFLCPGRGGDAVVLGIGGGYCDYDFSRQPGIPGNTHIHCEWGGFAPIISMWQCWRVFPGQPDHPGLPDPDIIPEGFGVPWALTGPTPDDQWPPPSLAPAGQVGPAAPAEPPPPEVPASPP